MDGDQEGRWARRRAVAADRGPAAKGRVAAADLERADLTSAVGRRRLVCAGFCTFYREDADEDQACAGFREICRLLDEAAARPEGLSPLRRVLRGLLEAADPVSYEHDADLERQICRVCDFVDGGDCDHRNPALASAERLEPCGGYILLAALGAVRTLSAVHTGPVAPVEAPAGAPVDVPRDAPIDQTVKGRP